MKLEYRVVPNAVVQKHRTLTKSSGNNWYQVRMIVNGEQYLGLRRDATPVDALNHLKQVMITKKFHQIRLSNDIHVAASMNETGLPWRNEESSSNSKRKSKRNHRTKAEKAEIVDRIDSFRSGGLSVLESCAMVDIKTTTYHRWKEALEAEPKPRRQANRSEAEKVVIVEQICRKVDEGLALLEAVAEADISTTQFYRWNKSHTQKRRRTDDENRAVYQKVKAEICRGTQVLDACKAHGIAASAFYKYQRIYKESSSANQAMAEPLVLGD